MLGRGHKNTSMLLEQAKNKLKFKNKNNIATVHSKKVEKKKIQKKK